MRRDREVRADHFASETLRNDLPGCGNTLTDDEYAAVMALVGKKPINKKSLDPKSKQDDDGNPTLFVDGGMVATAKAVAAVM